MIKSVGFLLLVGTCGRDACDAIPVTEKIWPTEQACMQVMERIKKRYPNEIFYCEEVLRNESTEHY
ncbi:hypothetical protein LFZ28_20325 [Salmonella enterica subsp. enterica serovar Milwaukee str. SA19950795]|uniref:hypothetical protein n=1 Tax=Salmonella enterica TaxID=28901 RepID=UPI00071AD9AD|nr:hypothetical protein [Salmonella enterica]AXD06243.1 hypothetical protein LFZ28_20325 [Salmonella enterica subsp. enterica serovar Milwaukee str. SA19950795]